MYSLISPCIHYSRSPIDPAAYEHDKRLEEVGERSPTGQIELFPFYLPPKVFQKNNQGQGKG